jgi:hypothetical protein
VRTKREVAGTPSGPEGLGGEVGGGRRLGGGQSRSAYDEEDRGGEDEEEEEELGRNQIRRFRR